MMKKRQGNIWTALLCSAALVQPLAASAVCTPVAGQVMLVPDASCQVAANFPGVTFVGACFSVTTRGALKGTGYSGLSQEIVAGADGATTKTPSLLLESWGGSRQLLTARTILSTNKGDLSTADVVITSPEATTEQLIVTGGTNGMTGVTGSVVVDGNSIGQWADYSGSLCKP
jgi:hypothetical protein